MQQAATLTPDRQLVIERVFDAPRELVFKAWTRVEYIVRWWGPDDFSVPFCELDFRVGGKYRFCMCSPNGENHWVFGEYKEIVEPELIVFTWNREQDDGVVWCRNDVSIRLDEIGNKTKLRLHQFEFENVDGRDDHGEGWGQCLNRLYQFVNELKHS